MADAEMINELRARLGEVHARHEADSRAAADAFWASLSQAPAHPSPTQQSPAHRARRRPGRTAPAGRSRGPRLREVGGHRRSGLWAQVPAEGPLPFHPREVESVWLDELDLEGADAEWFEARFAHALKPTEPREPTRSVEPWERRASEFDEPVAVKVDAMLGRPLTRHGSDVLAHTVEHLADLRAQQDVMLVNVVAELQARGEEPPGGLRITDWLRSLNPGMTAGQAKDVVAVAQAITRPRWDELSARVTMQHVSIAKAARIIEFRERNEPVADPPELTVAVHELVTRAPELIHEDFTALVRHHTEQVRPPRDDDRLDQGRRAARGLWFDQSNRTGMVAMRGVLDPEAAAVIKSAIDPLSVPSPMTDENGHALAPDPRTPATRRADALLEIVARGVAAGESLPGTDKAKVVVTIDHDVLAGRVRGTGLATTADVLSTDTVRRLACDAAIIPMVLGGRSEPLDVGRQHRLVTASQRVALWHRDRGCSYPGCTIPAAWTDAHHVTHWSDGGSTSLDNLALLCRRHHSHVHRHDLTASITPDHVTWHT
ncbi:HNH endonuclease [Intrasporangium calvum]|uniref:HNH endonuclease n=1 Tax=Intrasporangium calvum TaxID=53358 RepID=A0ABT5GM15_9MICO|nr:HNH endonuclease signature motif containing protein [Intrasporangium calvum]MDC5699086.1 HNH endonuclease [Intrasporangium calvum]